VLFRLFHANITAHHRDELKHMIEPRFATALELIEEFAPHLSREMIQLQWTALRRQLSVIIHDIRYDIYGSDRTDQPQHIESDDVGPKELHGYWFSRELSWIQNDLAK
jgi:hypothetical protein